MSTTTFEEDCARAERLRALIYIRSQLRQAASPEFMPGHRRGDAQIARRDLACTLRVTDGWTWARIARFLGVTRARAQALGAHSVDYWERFAENNPNAIFYLNSIWQNRTDDDMNGTVFHYFAYFRGWVCTARADGTVPINAKPVAKVDEGNQVLLALLIEQANQYAKQQEGNNRR